MSTHLALIALMLLPLPWTNSATHGDVSRVGSWTLRVHADRFTERLTRQLSEPRIEYLRQALVFHLSRRMDTSDAVYRIDGGPPIWARSDEMELVRLGFALHNDDLDNPSGGVVRIPGHRMIGGRAVSIETQWDHRPVKFKLDGFSAALDAALKAGCGEGDFR